jgi:single-stranded DNA-binding protein
VRDDIEGECNGRFGQQGDSGRQSGARPRGASFANGGKVVKFSIATSETWNDRSSGDRKEKTEWHNVVIYDEKIAEVAERYLKKGAKCMSKARCNIANMTMPMAPSRRSPRW